MEIQLAVYKPKTHLARPSPRPSSTSVRHWIFLVVLSLVWFQNLKCVSSEDAVNVNTLKLVQIVFRHGDRNPLVPYPTDPYKNESRYWPEGFGQLTNIGKLQLFDLGHYIRQRYAGFLNPIYNAKETLIWSSDKDRTIMSALALAAGLYPPVAESESDDDGPFWNPYGNFQIVPIRTLSKSEDRFLDTERNSCPKVKQAFKELLMTSDRIRSMNQKYVGFFKKLSTDTGYSVSYITPWLYYLHDTLWVQEHKNYTIPTWAQPLMQEDSPLLEIKRVAYTAFTMTPELKRLYSGELVKELLQNIRLNVPQKLILFSAHDLTITNLMNTLGIFNFDTVPHYASSLIIEYHKAPAGLGYVKIFFRNNTEHAPYEMRVPECGSPCDINKLAVLMAPYISQDWAKECELKMDDSGGRIAESIITNNASISLSSYTQMLSKMLSIAVAVWAWI